MKVERCTVVGDPHDEMVKTCLCVHKLLGSSPTATSGVQVHLLQGQICTFLFLCFWSFTVYFENFVSAIRYLLQLGSCFTLCDVFRSGL